MLRWLSETIITQIRAMSSGTGSKAGPSVKNKSDQVMVATKVKMLGKRTRSSSKTSSNTTKKKKSNEQCEGCLEGVDEIFTFLCGHSFCRGCIRGLFLAALSDQSLLPVRCCGKRVDQRLRRVVLTLAECDEFEAALEELEAPNQLYCPRKECSTFHNLDKVVCSSTGRFICHGCSSPLCANCRASHPSLTCAKYQSLPEHERSVEDLLFFAKAKKARYARCGACRRFVEHSEGCSHMVCRCGHSFTYGAERFTGAEKTSAEPVPAMQAAAAKVVGSAFQREEADCEHAWKPYNSTIKGSLVCHLCRKSKRCYQTACTKCYRRACPACQRNLP